MSDEKRPACITNIGWFWIILGGLMCFGTIAAFGGWWTVSGAAGEANEEIPMIVKLAPFLVLVQSGAGVAAIVPAVSFLRLKYWARTVLEVLS